MTKKLQKLILDDLTVAIQASGHESLLDCIRADNRFLADFVSHCFKPAALIYPGIDHKKRYAQVTFQEVLLVIGYYGEGVMYDSFLRHRFSLFLVDGVVPWGDRYRLVYNQDGESFGFEGCLFGERDGVLTDFGVDQLIEVSGVINLDNYKIIPTRGDFNG